MRALPVVLAVLLAVPARAQLFPSGEALSVLSLFGLAPHLARDRAHYTFNVVSPAGHTAETTLFEGLDGVPDGVSGGVWGVRPTLVMQGRFVGLNASVQLDFTSTTEVTDEVTYERSFGVTTRYHNGFNLAGLVSEDPPVMLTVGPLLHAHIGTRERIDHADGSHAQWGRLADVQLAPSVGFALLEGPLRVYGVGARHMSGLPWALANASTGEASGRWDLADPAAPGYDPDYVSAKESLQRVRSDGGYLLEGGATLTLGDARREPKLALGLAVARVQRDYTVSETGFGVAEAFSESDVRVMVSIGIAIPSGGL